MSILRTGIFAEFILFSLCAVAPLTAAAQVSGAPPPVAEATLDFLPNQTDPVALKCDALADYPGDPHHVGDGVAFERIGVVDALPVCEQTATHLSARPRNQYLYGRVLSAAQRHDETARQFSMADRAGYAVAALARLQQGYGVSHRNQGDNRRLDKRWRGTRDTVRRPPVSSLGQARLSNVLSP